MRTIINLCPTCARPFDIVTHDVRAMTGQGLCEECGVMTEFPVLDLSPEALRQTFFQEPF